MVLVAVVNKFRSRIRVLQLSTGKVTTTRVRLYQFGETSYSVVGLYYGQCSGGTNLGITSLFPESAHPFPLFASLAWSGDWVYDVDLGPFIWNLGARTPI